MFEGFVFDGSNTALIGVTLVVKGTEKGIATDFKGEFFLDLSEDLAKVDSVTIIVSYIGYARKEITVTRATIREKKRIILVMREDIAMTNFIVRRAPLHKRIWYGFKRLFSK